MAMAKAKLGVVLLLVAGTAAAGAGAVAHQVLTANQPAAEGEKQQARTDRSGDSLPPETAIRLGKELYRLQGRQGEVISLAFAPDGKSLATAGNDGTVRLWDLATGRQVRQLGTHTRGFSSVALSPDGKTVASADYGGTIHLVETSTGKSTPSSRPRSNQGRRSQRGLGGCAGATRHRFFRIHPLNHGRPLRDKSRARGPAVGSSRRRR
jgi:hypothetical protein